MDNYYSLYFDGENDYVQVINPITTLNEITTTLWAKFPEDTDGGAPHTFISDWAPSGIGEPGATFNLRYDPVPSILQIELKINGLVNSLTMPLIGVDFTTWNHIAFAYNGDVLTLYLNNNIATMDVGLDGDITTTNPDLYIGQEQNNSANYEGYMDQITIWEVALTESQIQGYASCPPVGDEVGLLAYWAIEEVGVAQIFDTTNNTYNGGLVNMVTSEAWSNDTPTLNCEQICLSSEEVLVTINNCGCTDPTADNFDSTANVDDGNCEYWGCMDSAANNFDSTANVDDGSCEYWGCMDSTANNYDSTANVDDGSCEYWGCMDSIANNYDPTANVDDGSCEYWGCMDSAANNFDSTANVDDGSCEYLGCTDPIANNFDPTANIDDGSCEYLGCTNSGACNFDSTANIDDGSCEFDTCAGCTDPEANNYNPNATIYDGSCEYLGCTDPTADNFDSMANVDDGSCEYWGCMDSAANNFDSTANIDDGSCEYWGCTNPDACNYNSESNTDDGSCQLCASREFNDGAYLDVDSEIINAQGITISFWVNDDDFCATPEDFATYIDFGSEDSYRYVIRNRSCKIEAFFEGDMLPTEFDWGTMEWGYPTASAAGGIGPQSGWRQITAVFCPTTITIYVSTEEGTSLVASNGTGVFFEQGFNLFAEDIKRMGSNQIDYEPANAMIDEVRVWGRALTQYEVEERAGLTTTLNMVEENNLTAYWKMDCENPFLNEVTGQIGVENTTIVNENFNGNGCEPNSTYDYECPPDQSGIVDCNACDPPAGCIDDGLQNWSVVPGTPACNYDYLAVEQTPNSCFYVWDYCPGVEFPEYYDCDCKCINDSDQDDVCDELEQEGCPDPTACNYAPDGTEPCIYAEDINGVDWLDCDGNCLNDEDLDGACDEYDNCIDTYNPNQEDLNGDGIGDDCDGIGLEENGVTKRIIKVTDILGREIKKETKGAALMYWYNTGEVEIKYTF